MLFHILILTIGFLATISSGYKFPFDMSRIVGGTDADKPIPYMASIVYYGSHHCGGAIINERTILTAAHCLLELNPRLMKVRVGTNYRYTGGQLIPVKNWKSHENFDTSTMDYDIGIIYLAEDIEMKIDEIESIELPGNKTEIEDGTKAIVTGWGLLEMNGPEPSILQIATVPIMNNKICEDLMKGKITPRMICAGYMEGGTDACQMDSGGPLVAEKKLIGIVSWGDGCARPERPGIYTKVSALRDWIDDHIKVANFY